jgi:hypothetical protein
MMNWQQSPGARVETSPDGGLDGLLRALMNKRPPMTGGGMPPGIGGGMPPAGGRLEGMAPPMQDMRDGGPMAPPGMPPQQDMRGGGMTGGGMPPGLMEALRGMMGGGRGMGGGMPPMMGRPPMQRPRMMDNRMGMARRPMSISDLARR